MTYRDGGATPEGSDKEVWVRKSVTISDLKLGKIL